VTHPPPGSDIEGTGSMNSLRLPFFTELDDAQNILVAGAAGT
jgi:hypothetical protein